MEMDGSRSAPHGCDNESIGMWSAPMNNPLISYPRIRQVILDGLIVLGVVLLLSVEIL